MGLVCRGPSSKNRKMGLLSRLAAATSQTEESKRYQESRRRLWERIDFDAEVVSLEGEGFRTARNFGKGGESEAKIEREGVAKKRVKKPLTASGTTTALAGPNGICGNGAPERCAVALSR